MFKPIYYVFYKGRRISILPIVIISILLVSVSTASAITYNGEIDGSEPREHACGFDLTDKIGPFQVSVTDMYTFDTAASVGVDVWLTTASTYNGGDPRLAGFPQAGAPDSQTLTLTTGVDYWVIIIDPCDWHGYSSWSLTITSPGTGSTIVQTVSQPDNRINWQYGDLNAVLYRNVDSNGNPMIDTYCWDGDNSWLGMRSDSSSANGTSADICDVTFYILSDGSYQFNINYDGKQYEIRCADFDCTDPDMTYYDPNE